MSRLAVAALLAVLVAVAVADVYMHNPRGSNNRLDGENTNRDNANRLFDSQNNDKGGYNTGFMSFYGDSVLSVEWTNQHGLGVDQLKTHSDIILQYTCDDLIEDLRDGATEETIQPDGTDMQYGMHEPFAWYAACAVRERNKGLYTADQRLNGQTARFTRQNPNGQRYGFECPEERDYYPYWHPTPWIDIAILTSQPDLCSEFRSGSNNVRKYGYCELTSRQEKLLKATKNDTQLFLAWLDAAQYNNESSCVGATYQWTEKAHGHAKPDCIEAPLSRDNHNGNVRQKMADGSVRGGFPAYYNWTLPNPSKPRQCVLRMRYNISTADYVRDLNATFNNVGQPIGVTENPEVTYYTGNNANGQAMNIQLQLAINTAQYGRTFEDRSHVFEIVPKAYSGSGKVYNLNVRGKRGNIVQVYPAVEYDFVPNELIVREDDRIHLQWTGSNTNPPNNDGEGVRGSDRSNVVQMQDGKRNYPGYIADYRDYSRFQPLFAKKPNQKQIFELSRMALNMAEDSELLPNANIQSQLNDAQPHYGYGVLSLAKGKYYYMSTRNNNFSNRSQKGQIKVKEKQAGPVHWAVWLGTAIFVAIMASCVVIAYAVFAVSRPDAFVSRPFIAAQEWVFSFVNH